MSIAAPPPAPPANRESDTIVLHGVSWELYEQLLHEINNHRLRHSYSDGILEIMVISYGHERPKSIITRLIETFTEELDIPLISAGNTTLKSQLKEKGLEPDECYYVAHAEQMVGRTELDIETDPPPDLSIEIDITRTVLNRLDIYAALGVPEIWRYHKGQLEVFVLDEEGYVSRQESRAFPFLPLDELSAFLETGQKLTDTERVKQFRRWVRERFTDRLPAE
ncbi:MAG: Uma2 family endonuclease [Planctomycetaceae bacterium]